MSNEEYDDDNGDNNDIDSEYEQHEELSEDDKVTTHFLHPKYVVFDTGYTSRISKKGTHRQDLLKVLDEINANLEENKKVKLMYIVDKEHGKNLAVSGRFLEQDISTEDKNVLKIIKNEIIPCPNNRQDGLVVFKCHKMENCFKLLNYIQNGLYCVCSHAVKQTWCYVRPHNDEQCDEFQLLYITFKRVAE
jgi:hypothetical protein